MRGSDEIWCKNQLRKSITNISEVVENYFNSKFEPVEWNPCGITSEDLKRIVFHSQANSKINKYSISIKNKYGHVFKYLNLYYKLLDIAYRYVYTVLILSSL